MKTIRRARPEDLRSILRIENRSFGVDAWRKPQFLGYLADPLRSIFLVATLDSAIVGYLIAFVRGNGAEIDSIAVSPAQRGKRIAGSMMRRALAILRRRRSEAVFLSVRLNNDPAIRLYQKFGFQRVRQIKEYYEDGAPALRMKLILPPPV
jgi:[ribosomal protein S18]-alanine N-acetyltransferase